MRDGDFDFTIQLPEGHDVEELFDYLADNITLDDDTADLSFSANGLERTVTIHIWRGE